MAGPERIEWRRGVPSARLTVLAWYAFGAALFLGLVWLLFGGEPAELDTGRRNPLVYVLPVAVAVVLLGALPLLLPVLRRPVVAANHFALTVRGGWWRTLIMPWAKVAEVAAYRVGGTPYLLVRCRQSLDSGRDMPRWLDQAVLRAAMRDRRRGDPSVGDFHLAVRMEDFVGGSSALVATLAAFAPDDVPVAGDLADEAQGAS
jgi:hypothetical protein